jgi:hypothetical protein
MNDKTQREADEDAIVRVFTRDRAYCVDMIERLFVRPDTEQSRLMSCRLLEGIYECKREPLFVQAMPRLERMRYYADKIEWLTDNCQRYTQAARQVASVGGEGRAALEENWRLWQEALGEEEFGEENDRPTTVDGMLRELSAIMHPNVQEFPWRDATVQGRRMKYREYRKAKEGRARLEAGGTCMCMCNSPGALGLLDALPGADRVHAQDRRGQRPY